MTLRWVEGFEIDGGSTYYEAKYQNRPQVAAAAGGRLFGNRMSGTTLVTFPLASAPIDEWVVGIGWFTGANPDPATDFIKFYNGGLEQFGVHLRTDRKLEVRRGATVIATGTTVLPNADWAYIEFKALLHTSAGSYELRIDGITELTGTALDTSESNLNDADVVKFASNPNNRFDDIYILDTAGGTQNDFLGPRVVEGLLPTGDGDTLEWTPSSGIVHYELVDDPAALLDLVDFNHSNTIGEIDLYKFNNLSHITGDINGVAVNSVIGLDVVGSRTFKVKYRNSDDVEGDGPTLTVNSTKEQNLQGIMEQDPSGTPSQWSLNDIDTGQFGVEVVS